MSKHLQSIDVTRSIDPLHTRLHELIDLDTSTLDLELDLTHALEVRHTADGEQSLITLDSCTILQDSS